MSNQEKTFTFSGLADNTSDLLSECSDISYMSDLDLDFDLDSFNYDLSNGSPIETNNFKIVHYNVNSILAPGRLDELSDICKILKVDVLVITESKIDQTIPTNIITLPGYHEPLRHDRPINGRNGGGVLMYIADKIVFHHKTELQSEFYEHMWVDIKIKNKIFAINALYRPPSQTAADHDLNDYTVASHKIIASDLNFGNCYCKT